MKLGILTDYKFWLFLIVIVIFILWLIYGGEKKKFIGLQTELDNDRRAIKDLYEQGWEVRHKKEVEVVIGDNDGKPKKPDLSQFSEDFDDVFVKIPKIKPVKSGKRISKGERECKKCIEEIYGKPFNCVRPNFLKNPETGRNLEIDCYNDELKIGVEYNGSQHYVYPNCFHKTQEEFMKQLRRDALKIELCDANGVYLISVPYNIKLENIKSYIKERLPPEQI